jgi:osmotically inducible protein OsmC
MRVANVPRLRLIGLARSQDKEEPVAIRTAEAEWKGNLQQGKGKMKLGSGAFEGAYDFRSRMTDGEGTNPEELIGAAHAGCFSMALSAQLTGAGFTPERIYTTAKVHFEKLSDGFAIPRIELETEAEVPGLEDAAFQQYAETAKKNCPVSKALAGVDIRLVARLGSSARSAA